MLRIATPAVDKTTENPEATEAPNCFSFFQ